MTVGAEETCPRSLVATGRQIGVAGNLALVEAWLQYCRDAESAADKTIVAYRKGMEIFLEWLDVNAHTGDITPWVIVAFKGWLQERGYSPQTVNLRLAAVRSFFRWTVIAGLLERSPAEGIKGARRSSSGRHKRDRLTDGEVLAVLATCDDTLVGIRDRAILTLMAYCALRVIEVHRLNLGHVRTQDDRLVLDVQGKGRQQADELAVVPYSQEEP